MRNISRSMIALIFLAVFSSAVARNISCDLGNLPFFAHHGVSDHGHNHGDLHHHHRHSHDASGHHHDHEHDEEDNADDQCCRKLSEILRSGFEHPAAASFQFISQVPAVTVPAESLTSVTSGIRGSHYYSWKAPPPKIPDIRVFIRSFII